MEYRYLAKGMIMPGKRGILLFSESGDSVKEPEVGIPMFTEDSYNIRKLRSKYRCLAKAVTMSPKRRSNTDALRKE